MASKLTYIKHNLILEHPDLFKTSRKRKAETPEEEEFDAIFEEIYEEISDKEDC